MPSTRNGGTSGGQEALNKDHKDNKVDEDESSASEEDSFSYDEGESERIKSKCLDDMVYLEHQFSELKELLYKERMDDVEQKINLLSKVFYCWACLLLPPFLVAYFQLASMRKT
jgi:breast cancer metastasis-suppressor 1-like protein